MNIEVLKNELPTRSFWSQESQVLLLPEQNLLRQTPLEGLATLKGSNLITCLMGQRRAGKSVVVRQYIHQLWQDGIPPCNILYINFFLRPLKSLQKEELFYQVLHWWMTELVDKNKPS